MKGMRTLCAMAVLAVWTPALAGTIAYVDYAALMQKAPQVAASERLLKQEYAPRLVAIRKQASKLKSLHKQLEDLGPGASSLKRASLIEKFRHTRSALGKAEKAYQSGLGLRRVQLRDNFRQVVDNDIKAYAKAHGIDLVVKGAGVYVGQGVDVTAAILQQLREDYRKVQAQEKKTQKP